jgi:hypothetical protein
MGTDAVDGRLECVIFNHKSTNRDWQFESLDNGMFSGGSLPRATTHGPRSRWEPQRIWRAPRRQWVEHVKDGGCRATTVVRVLDPLEFHAFCRDREHASRGRGGWAIVVGASL